MYLANNYVFEININKRSQLLERKFSLWNNAFVRVVSMLTLILTWQWSNGPSPRMLLLLWQLATLKTIKAYGNWRCCVGIRYQAAEKYGIATCLLACKIDNASPHCSQTHTDYEFNLLATLCWKFFYRHLAKLCEILCANCRIPNKSNGCYISISCILTELTNKLIWTLLPSITKAYLEEVRSSMNNNFF